MKHKINIQMSQRLRNARLQAGFVSATQAILHYSFRGSTYRAHENGQNRFNIEYAKYYAKAFNVSPSWLLIGEGIIANTPTTVIKQSTKSNKDRRIKRSDKIYALSLLLKDDWDNILILHKIKKYIDEQISEIT